MEPLTWAIIGTFVGTIVGASASILTTYLNVQNSSKIQEKIEHYKRQEISREFQRNNYLEIQNTVHKSLRLATLLHFEDLKNYKKTGEWQKSLLNSENDYNLMISIRDLSMLSERVENIELRKELKSLINKISKLNNTSSKSESDEIIFELAPDKIDFIMEKIGTELRKNY